MHVYIFMRRCECVFYIYILELQEHIPLNTVAVVYLSCKCNIRSFIAGTGHDFIRSAVSQSNPKACLGSSKE